MHSHALHALAALLLIAADNPKGDQDAMQGEWRQLLPRGKTKGGDAPRPEIKLVVKGNQQITLLNGRPTTPLPYLFEVNTSTKPKTIIYYYYDRKLAHGIYELDGDSLRICTARISTAIPERFDSNTREYKIIK
jgi:uncharacterized protein (TIGR03067 family)